MHFPFDNTLGLPSRQRGIFVVAGKELDRSALVDSLREAGIDHPCRFFSTGDEIIEALIEVLKGATPPLLCFIDTKMPDMCGLDVLKWIRLQDALSEVSIVMLSPAGDPVSLSEALRCGAQCYSAAFPRAAQLREILGEAEKFSAVACGRNAFNLPCNLLLTAQAAGS